MTEITIPSNTMNDQSITTLDFSRFKWLRRITIGDECFMYVNVVTINALPVLESVVMGRNSLTKTKNGKPTKTPNRGFYLTNCHSLVELSINRYSLSDYALCVIDNDDRLEVIELGELNKESYNFRYAPYTSRSECKIGTIMNRLAQFEISSLWYSCIQ